MENIVDDIKEEEAVPTPRLSFGVRNIDAIAEASPEELYDMTEAPAEQAADARMQAGAEATPVPTIETPVMEAEEGPYEQEVLTQGEYDYTAADSADVQVQAEQPPVDNDHVEPGATLFTEEEIAMNADNGVTGDDENTYPDDRAYAAAEVEAGNEPEAGVTAPDLTPQAEPEEELGTTEVPADIDEAEAVNETMDALAVPAVEPPTEETVVAEAQEADVSVLSDTAPDGDEKSVEEMITERERIDAEIKAKQDAQKAGVIAQIKTVALTYGITADELAEAMGGVTSKRKGIKAKPKYKDPATGVVWTGRGKAPAWIKGKNFADFLITP